MKPKRQLSCRRRGCNITFAKQQELNEHMDALHRKMYFCNHCPYKGATRDSTLQKHIKKEHPELSDVPLNCSNESGGNDALRTNLSLPSPPYDQPTHEPYSLAAFTLPQPQTIPTMQYPLPSIPETSYPTIYASLEGPPHRDGLNNGLQFGFSASTPRSHPSMVFSAEEPAAMTGLTTYGYTNTLGDFAGSTNHNNGNGYAVEEQLGSTENVGGGSNYSWRG